MEDTHKGKLLVQNFHALSALTSSEHLHVFTNQEAV